MDEVIRRGGGYYNSFAQNTLATPRWTSTWSQSNSGIMVALHILSVG